MKRIVLCRVVALDPKGCRPTITATAEFRALLDAGCRADYIMPQADVVTTASPCMAIIDVPDAQETALEATFTAIAALPGTWVLPRLRGSDGVTGPQRTAIRAALNALGVDGTAAAAASADFGDFLRYVAVTAWQNTQFDKARIT